MTVNEVIEYYNSMGILAFHYDYFEKNINNNLTIALDLDTANKIIEFKLFNSLLLDKEVYKQIAGEKYISKEGDRGYPEYAINSHISNLYFGICSHEISKTLGAMTNTKMSDIIVLLISETDSDKIKIRQVYYINNDFAIPSKCLITIDDLNNMPYKKISLKYSEISSNINDVLGRKYKLPMDLNEVIYTNDNPEATKYIINDRNTLRLVSQSYNHYSLDSTFTDNRVLLNPNLNYFTPFCKEMPIEHLLALFDVTPKDMLAILKKVSYLTNPIVSLGLGGLMSNFFFWTDRLREYFNLPFIFKRVRIYDYDELDYSNLFRFPLNWIDYKLRNKSTAIEELSDFISTEDPHYFTSSNNSVSKVLLFKSVNRVADKCELYNNAFNFDILAHSILIGGPDLDTRLRIYTEYSNNPNISFICPTHADETLDITFYPHFDNQLLIESYGKINLNRFLLTMFKMTIELLKILANKEFVGKYKHKHLEWKFNGEELIENSKKHKCLKDVCYIIN